MANSSMEFRDSVGTNNTGNSGTGGDQTNATALPANSARTGFQIQNTGTNPLFVYFGAGASTSVYNFILKAATGSADGTGGSVSMMDGNVYRGLITIAGTTPHYCVLEL